MILLGLTGSIGMGKTETAKIFARLGVPAYNADDAVHTLYSPGGKAVAPVSAAFPGVEQNGAIDRNLLSARVLNNPALINRLETIVHPLVGEAQRSFLAQAQTQGASMVLLDIPLLFETGGQGRVQRVIVVSAPPDVQRQRVLERPGMTVEKFEAILARQVPDAEKRARADFVIDTSQGLAQAEASVVAILAYLMAEGRPI